jgi:hypothetical protein
MCAASGAHSATQAAPSVYSFADVERRVAQPRIRRRI